MPLRIHRSVRLKESEKFCSKPKESAEKLLNQLGLIGEFVGEGPSVTKQSISPDEVVDGNSKITLTLGY